MPAPAVAFRQAVEAGDGEALRALLADDVRFHSPVAHGEYRGPVAVGGVLQAVVAVFEDFAYEDELAAVGDGPHGLVFRARVGDRQVHGIDLLRFAEDGRVAELTVMLRPLSAVVAVRDAMAAALAAAGVDPKALSGPR